jgi:hypothetical protein
MYAIQATTSRVANSAKVLSDKLMCMNKKGHRKRSSLFRRNVSDDVLCHWRLSGIVATVEAETEDVADFPTHLHQDGAGRTIWDQFNQQFLASKQRSIIKAFLTRRDLVSK